jgi:hypothetical protein
MRRGFSRRGQPLIVLILLLGGWVSARAMMWDSAATGRPETALPAASTALAKSVPAAQIDRKIAQAALVSTPLAIAGRAVTQAIGTPAPGPAGYPVTSSRPLISLPPRAPVLVGPHWRPDAPPAQPARGPSGHQMMWMAALAQIGNPLEIMRLQPSNGLTDPRFSSRPVPGRPDTKLSVRRWSADGWMLWRSGGQSTVPGGILTPSYGASQAGVVVRYRLISGSTLKPSAYLRTTTALNGSAEREAALGFSLRPLSRLPLAIAGEARFSSLPGRNMVRPAAFAVTELPPFRLPLGLRGEVYDQAGYVGGAFATGFADGQLRLDRRLIPLRKGELRLGAGLWGGVQKGASRLDAGPSLTISQPFGGSASMRLGADWRFRVAGKAAPGSGPAVTLSAGF